jgi:hypothetical protein
MTETNDADLVRREVDRAARVFGMHDADDAFTIGGDLFSNITVTDGRVVGISSAMTQLKRRSPALFKDARQMSPDARAAELRRISRDHEHGFDKEFHDRKIDRMKAEQKRYLAKRSQTQ